MVPYLPATLTLRFIRRITGGGFYHSASVEFGARAAVQAAMLVAKDRASLMPPANK
jgi:hypothetical protein